MFNPFLLLLAFVLQADAVCKDKGISARGPDKASCDLKFMEEVSKFQKDCLSDTECIFGAPTKSECEEVTSYPLPPPDMKWMNAIGLYCRKRSDFKLQTGATGVGAKLGCPARQLATATVPVPAGTGAFSSRASDPRVQGACHDAVIAVAASFTCAPDCRPSIDIWDIPYKPDEAANIQSCTVAVNCIKPVAQKTSSVTPKGDKGKAANVKGKASGKVRR